VAISSLATSAMAAQTWSTQFAGPNKSQFQIYWNGSGSPSQYAVVDLTSGYIRLVDGPSSGWGTSVDVMPCYWSNSVLYQGYPIAAIGAAAGTNFLLKLRGTSQGLTTTVLITFFPPTPNVSFAAQISATTTGTVALDNRPGEAFKPIFLSSMHDSATSWDSVNPFVGTYPSATGWILQPSQNVLASTWGLTGGTSQWKTNAPTMTVTSAAPYQIAGWLTQDTDPNGDNVGFWAATATVPTSWNFTVTAS